MCKTSKETTLKKLLQKREDARYNITDNKKFWKTIWLYFSNKGYNQTKITIVDKDSIITEGKKCNSNE